jgi:hypothetical protein
MPPMDKNGCVAASEVRDICNGIGDVLGGPTARNKQCCYEVCRTIAAPCGRPLMIDGTARTAPALTLRSALATAWLADARMEHASVASFARFTLELMAVGAPMDMIEEAQRAGLDEIAHARACLAIAQTYAKGEGLEAGALDVSGLTIRTSLSDVVRAAVSEGCCGETLAAIALQRASASCVDQDTRAVLALIADDEARHAQLAFRFVAWAVATGGNEVRAAVAEAFEHELRALSLGTSSQHATVDAVEWRAAGRLTDSDLLQVRREAAAMLRGPAAALAA